MVPPELTVNEVASPILRKEFSSTVNIPDTDKTSPEPFPKFNVLLFRSSVPALIVRSPFTVKSVEDN